MKRALAFLVLSLIPLGARGEGFIELGIGQSEIDLDIGPLPPSVSVSKDEKDTTWAVSGGWMFNPMFGLEIGYRDLGEVSLSATDGVDTVSATAEVDGFTLGLVVRVPATEKLFIVPRLGLYRWEGKGRILVNGVQVESVDDDGTDLYFGVGADYAFTRSLFAGAHFVRYDVDGDDALVFELRLGFRF
jgi:hypothetical protein